ncbi:MAG: replicative DNA helicase [Patescibacteria group bacterium]
MAQRLQPLPHVREAERAILGGCLLNNDAIPEAMTALQTGDFYSEAHRLVWGAITTIYPGQPADWATVTARLKGSGHLAAVGGVEFLTSLVDAIPSIRNLKHYIGIVKEKSIRRQLMAVCQDAALSASTSDRPVSELVADVEQVCFNLSNAEQETGPVPFSEINRKGMKRFNQRADGGNLSRGIKTGFVDLDRETGGFRPGEMILIGARPSMGKTAWVLDMLLNVCRQYPAFLFTLEMGGEDIWDRVVTKKARAVPLHILRGGNLTEKETSEVIRVIGDIDDMPLYVDDGVALKPSEILHRIQHVSIREKIRPGFVAIDYVQIMRPDSPVRSREQEVAQMSSAIKAMAKRLQCPVVALSQLSRENVREKKADYMPRLHDFRDSGALEQDADVVIGLWRKHQIEHLKSEETRSHAEFGILKQRNGPTGRFDMRWEPFTSSFHDVGRDNSSTRSWQDRDEDTMAQM